MKPTTLAWALQIIASQEKLIKAQKELITALETQKRNHSCVLRELH